MIKRHVILMCCWVIAACGGEEPRDQPAKAPPSRSAPMSSKPVVPPMTQIEKPTPRDPRLLLLDAEWSAYRDAVITHDAGPLDDNEKAMLRHLLEASRLVEEIHMLQLHPENLKWRDRLAASGADIERQIFTRYQAPWCEDNPSTACRAVEEAPARRIGAGLWPADWKPGEFKKLGREINARELLSPFTVVRRSAEGGYTAIPYARTDLFGPKMRRLAAALREAAAGAPDKTLKRFLEQRADAFESERAFPYDESDYAWIALEGDWEVTVGPYEVYRTPHKTKALFEMYIGRENKAVTAELAAFKADLQEMENGLQELVGDDIYKGRQPHKGIAIRAVDIWMAAGDGRRSRGATVAFHLPNRGRAVEEYLYKKVIMVNHKEAFEPVTKARAELVLDPGQRADVSPEASIINTTFHELSHGFGAYHEMRITNKEGKRTTVKQALKEHESLMEELKADALGLWLSQYQKAKGTIDNPELRRRHTSALLHLVGLFQYPLSDTYARMAAIELGWYLDAGGLVWNEAEGWFAVVPEKLSGAVASLARHVATLQLTGDFEAADALARKYVTPAADESYGLNDSLTTIRKVVLDKFKAADLKSPSLRYRVTGL